MKLEAHPNFQNFLKRTEKIGPAHFVNAYFVFVLEKLAIAAETFVQKGLNKKEREKLFALGKKIYTALELEQLYSNHTLDEKRPSEIKHTISHHKTERHFHQLPSNNHTFFRKHNILPNKFHQQMGSYFHEIVKIKAENNFKKLNAFLMNLFKRIEKHNLFCNTVDSRYKPTPKGTGR